MDADRIKHLRFLAETAFMSPAARDAFVELLNAHEPILNGSAISAARKEAAECRKRAGDAEDAQAQLEERMVILRGQLRLANSVMLKTERDLIEARSQLALAMQWGGELLVERDMLATDLAAARAELHVTQESVEVLRASSRAVNCVTCDDDPSRCMCAFPEPATMVAVLEDDGDPA